MIRTLPGAMPPRQCHAIPKLPINSLYLSKSAISFHICPVVRLSNFCFLFLFLSIFRSIICLEFNICMLKLSLSNHLNLATFKVLFIYLFTQSSSISIVLYRCPPLLSITNDSLSLRSQNDVPVIISWLVYVSDL